MSYLITYLYFLVKLYICL